MTDATILVEKFWKALDADRTVMLCAEGVAPRPMTALREDGQGPIWFFTAIDTEMGRATEGGKPLGAVLMLTSKGHDVFASATGQLEQHNDREVIDRLWNPFIAAWYTGKDDPKLRLMRFQPDQAEVWENGNSLLAGIKMLIGIDPKRDFKDQAKQVKL